MPTSFAVKRPAVGHLDADLVRAVDDVVVRQDVAVAGDDDARSEPALLASARGMRRGRAGRTGRRRTGGTCRRPALELRRRHAGLALGADRDDGRRDDLDDVGVRIASAGDRVSDRRGRRSRRPAAPCACVVRDRARPRRYQTAPAATARQPRDAAERYCVLSFMVSSTLSAFSASSIRRDGPLSGRCRNITTVKGWGWAGSGCEPSAEPGADGSERERRPAAGLAGHLDRPAVASTIALTRLRPSPRPRSARLASPRNSRSQMRGSSSGGMPRPVSRTLSTRQSAVARRPRRRRARRRGVYLTALSMQVGGHLLEADAIADDDDLAVGARPSSVDALRLGHVAIQLDRAPTTSASGTGSRCSCIAPLSASEMSISVLSITSTRSVSSTQSASASR